MKVIDKTEEKQFQPITLELTIESPEELVDFWHRMYCSQIDLLNVYSRSSVTPQLDPDVPPSSYNIWKELNKYVREESLEDCLWKES